MNTSTHDPGREVFRQALRFMAILLGALTVVGTTAGWWIGGLRGVWGALLGVGVAAVFSGTTVISVGKTINAGPIRMVTVVLGTWLVKMIVVFVVLIVLSPFDFFHRLVMGAVLFVGVVGTALLDYRAVSSARLTYVNDARDQSHNETGLGTPST